MLKFAYLLAVTLSLIYSLTDASSPPNDIQLFQKWFVKNGGIVNGLDINDFPEMGRGLLAVNNITKGDKVLFIPKKLMLSSSLAKSSSDPIHRQLAESFPKDDELMVAFVLLEKTRGKDSFWSPYIKVLPNYVPNLAQYDRDELDVLQSPTFANEVVGGWHQTIQSYNHFHEQIHSYWPSNPRFVTLKDYMWASSIIDSRGFRFRGEIYLAPFSDMFNYSPHPEPRPADGGKFFLEHHILSKDGLEVRADRDCRSGFQLFEDYGDNSDRIYLQYHGFMPESNPFRCVQIEANPLDHPSIPPKKQLLLKEFRFKKPPSKCVDETGDLGQMLTAYLTLLALNDEEEYRCLETLHSDHNQWQRVQAACGILHTSNFLSTLLKSSPSKLESNLKLRKDSLDERIHQQILSLLVHNTRNLTITSMREDYYQILAVKSQLTKERSLQTNDSSQFLKLLKRLNALNYRYFTKEHVWNVCFKYGTSCNFESPPPRSHSPVSLDEDTCSTGVDVENKDKTENTCSSTLTTTTDTTETEIISTKFLLSHIWNQTKEQKENNLNLYLQEFNKWFNSQIHEPARNTLLAKYLPGYRIGTVTIQSLALDEIYLAIPPSLIMDLMSAGNERKIGSLLNNLLRHYKGRDDYHGLIFHLLYESFYYGSESTYWNYLRLLPSPQEMDIPLFWTEDEITSRLGPSSLKKDMLEYKARVKRSYEMISGVPLLQDLVELNVLNEETYTWATAILDSRSIWWNGQRHLVPMLDFINCQERMGERNEIMRVHSTKAETFPLSNEFLDLSEGEESKMKSEITLATTHAAWPFRANEQLFENYGQPNHIYFAYHGFILDSNSNDCVQFRIDLTDDERKRIDLMKASHVFEYLRISPSKAIPPISLCVNSKMTFDEIPQRVWVYLSLKANQYGSGERDLITKPTSPGKLMLINLIKAHHQQYLQHDNKKHPHNLSQRFLRSEQDILEKWLAMIEEQK